MKRIYLDHASASPLRPEAQVAMIDAIGLPAGDPGRLHADALPAREVIEVSRQHVAALVDANARYVTFVSGLPEAVATWLHRGAGQPPPNVVTSPIERRSVLDSIAGRRFDVDVDGGGRLDVQSARTALTAAHSAADAAGPGGPVRGLFQQTNSETGVIQPATQVVDAFRKFRTPVMIDIAQTLVDTGVSLPAVGADAVYIDSSLIGGPPGIGAIVTDRRGRFTPLLVGSSQERGRRAGLEATTLIAGFGAACAAALTNQATESTTIASAAKAWDERVMSQITDVRIVGNAPIANSVRTVVVEGVIAEGLVIALDQRGISAHSGSACSAEMWEPSPVLTAMGVDSDSSLRVSFGWNTTMEDIDRAVDALIDAVRSMRALGRPSTG